MKNNQKQKKLHECTFSYGVYIASSGRSSNQMNAVIVRHLQQLRQLEQNGMLVSGGICLDFLDIMGSPVNSVQYRPGQTDEDINLIFAAIARYANPVSLSVTCRYNGTFRDSPIYPMHEELKRLNPEMLQDIVYSGYDRDVATGQAKVIIANSRHLIEM